jgi:hypothetical protein
LYYYPLRLNKFCRLKQRNAILPEIFMKNPKIYPLLLALLIYVFVLAACAKQSSDRRDSNPSGDKHATSSSASQLGAATEQQGGTTQPSATPPAVAGNKGTPATEKHRLNLTNYSGVPITITLNGEWFGRWVWITPNYPLYRTRTNLLLNFPVSRKEQ